VVPRCAEPSHARQILAHRSNTNIPRQQVGTCSKGCDETVLHPVQEALIANMHRGLGPAIGVVTSTMLAPRPSGQIAHEGRLFDEQFRRREAPQAVGGRAAG
jgi:hypothetical protein